MEATEFILKLPSAPSMTPDAVRSRARREAAKAKPKPKVKAKRKPKKKAVRKPKAGAVVRSERLDMRLTKAEKAKINARAKKTRRTVTSLVIEAIEKIK
jgi:hypothetical protein